MRPRRHTRHVWQVVRFCVRMTSLRDYLDRWSEEQRFGYRACRAYPSAMSMTVHLPGKVAAALEAEAARRGQSPDQVAAELLAAQLPRSGREPHRTLAFAGVGSSSSGRGAAEADELLAEGFGRD